ncbi:MAG: hypothetical protein ACR2L0_06235, partial [Gaiellaceae bacterium]
TVTLYPLYHPAAALYTPAMLRTLEEDFARIPALIGEEPAPVAQVIRFPVAAAAVAATQQDQLGLFWPRALRRRATFHQSLLAAQAAD